ncbi:hypothetical protein P154DRAFT_74252 [Amniculicola lignicola CBS 123094]|uniref:Helix-turn-helix domain-containing protein n=1 Tax=Amniculicola lignicola CBS 123094 TaxID=1392246 RepID=A0A6A5WUM6_9PLEO|nr:hypothetical protein P154DRAFT_74252 [Amniculicola lignicola CBS 123094]
MGSAASNVKASRAGATVVRKYPSRASPTTTARAAAPEIRPAQPGPAVHSSLQATVTKNKFVDADARDPLLASRLSHLGPVQPNPHYSSTSTSSLDPYRNQSSSLPSDMMSEAPVSAFPSPRDNPALRVLAARQRIQEEGDTELEGVGKRGFEGRKYLDVGVLQLALMRRKRGEPDARIEEALSIKKGRLSVLGKGIVEAVS